MWEGYVMAEQEKRKQVNWIFDNGMMKVDTVNSVKADVESRFQFELVIYKDADTHIESIRITNYKDGQENGSIVTSILDLGKDIRNFKKFGVVIGDTYFRDLARRIEEEYANIEVGEVNLSKSDTRYNELITEVKGYLAGSAEYITEDFCYIPVNMFNEICIDCGYSDYEMKNLRGQLAQDKYIHVVSGRYAILKRLGNKPERVIAFYRKKLGIEIPVKPAKKTEKGDKDE